MLRWLWKVFLVPVLQRPFEDFFCENNFKQHPNPNPNPNPNQWNPNPNPNQWNPNPNPNPNPKN